MFSQPLPHSTMFYGNSQNPKTGKITYLDRRYILIIASHSQKMNLCSAYLPLPILPPHQISNRSTKNLKVKKIANTPKFSKVITNSCPWCNSIFMVFFFKSTPKKFDVLQMRIFGTFEKFL